MDTNSNIISQTIRQRLIIRVSRLSLSFSTVEDGNVVFEPYTVKSGISMAANLREAFKTAALPAKNYDRSMVMVDSEVLMIPVDFFNEADKEVLFLHSFPGKKGEAIFYNVLPELNAVAISSINKDLRMVITDRLPEAKFVCAVSPVWRYLHKRSYTGQRNKLFGYFHDSKLEIFSYNQNRFKFCNSFDTNNTNDAVYFLLHVWKQLQLDQEHDEIHIVGDIPEKEKILENLRKYIQRAYVINPTGDFNRAPVTQIKGMPYDMMTYYVKGR